MPITLTLTEGALPPSALAPTVARITEAFLDAHGLAGHPVMTPNVTTHLVVLPEGTTFSGGRPVVGAWIETKTPAFALAERAVQSRFFAAATRILHDASDGRLEPARIWSNGVPTVDGTWNIDGVARGDEEIVAALKAPAAA
ncbi:MAG: 4-oxalocrotonate tautomerase [Phyllobacteriaceae bacterium]|nr:4-oxalocrotonate tautomerase [Phyllobacteriaceae bacterium]